MLRLLGVGLLGALVLSAGSAAHGRLTKEGYTAAVEHAINVVREHESPIAERRKEIERVVDRLERLEPPAEVAAIHTAWISSLQNCAARYRKLEGSSPLDGVIVAREMKPCFDSHREICDRFYAKGYSFD